MKLIDLILIIPISVWLFFAVKYVFSNKNKGNCNGNCYLCGKCKLIIKKLSMKEFKFLQFDKERALYGINDALIEACSFSGEADGESPLKETNRLIIKNSIFKLRYALWHSTDVKLYLSSMFDLCRAPLWYCKNVSLDRVKILGVKAIRECQNVNITNSDINSAEFGWKSNIINISDSVINGEYIFLFSNNLDINRVKINGKYSFQYVENANINNCELFTKDAFWHSKNVTVKNSVVKGEYLGWYSENLTLINCKIIGTQPLCYAKNLKLINCETENCDLAFENSTIDATIIGNIDSVKNPIGIIKANNIGETIIDQFSRGECEIIIK